MHATSIQYKIGIAYKIFNLKITASGVCRSRSTTVNSDVEIRLELNSISPLLVA
jgi:hypothetical protein